MLLYRGDWRGETGQMDRRNVGKVLKEISLNFTSTINFDCCPGVVWSSNRRDSALLPMYFPEVLIVLLRVRYSIFGRQFNRK